MLFNLTSKTGGVDLGIFEAESSRDAIEAMWAEAGYSAPWEAKNCDEDLLCDADDLIVTEVTDSEETN
jgi:hypothetical protein